MANITTVDPAYKDYVDFVRQVGYGKLDDVDVTHDGYPLSQKEAMFIDTFVQTGNAPKALKAARIGKLADVASKDYIIDEIRYRFDLVKKQSIADADEIMQYFTGVMRGEIKDQFGLDAPLSERTAAARELARRIIDIDTMGTEAPEIKVTLNFEGI